ncbi:hypothetical protein ACIPPN_26985 [Streptomyces diastaticus]|uniref:Uncharacterized protein n=1 Tax=Streptomyces diastaticus subsp. diastaticus TaxID=68040 RepID=A0ABQ1CYK1_STRDI|nr:hypothetical protein [Streptomyces diastaticus]GFH75191.1 hypothetical protein Sdia_59590 [Streptomyces diastaticus subsp. diastaticus]GGU45007.1 hypothetical protein GCM10015534_54380 [Streptomyces diastaticus subsp. diastaticus]
MTHPAPDPAVVVEELKATVVALTAQLGALAGAPPALAPSPRPARARQGKQVRYRQPTSEELAKLTTL